MFLLSRMIEYKEKININQEHKEKLKTAIRYEDLLQLQSEKEQEFNNIF